MSSAPAAMEPSAAVEAGAAAGKVSSPAAMAWRTFRRHKLGMGGAVVLIVLYLIAIFAGFVAPYDDEEETRDLQWAPPTQIHFKDASGFSRRPFVNPISMG